MIDNLTDAIAHAKEVAEELKKQHSELLERPNFDRQIVADCWECAREHEQLASWLEELKERREADRWIPVSEGLPNRNGVYNVTRIIEGTRITGACYFDGQNTWHSDICVNHGRPYLNDIIAWRPIPEPYKESEDK